MMRFSRSAWFASIRGSAAALAFALLVAAAGCKKDGNGNLAKNDPLFGRIPKQNIPFPDRAAGDPKDRDPLLGSPTSGSRAHAGPGYTDDPARWKNGLYVPDVNGTPAALASRPIEEGDELKMSGVGLTPAGGLVPSAPPSSPASAAATSPASPTLSDAAFDRLAAYGIKRGDYSIVRETGRIIVSVNYRKDADGPVHGYTGQGATEAIAVQQVIDQLKTAK